MSCEKPRAVSQRFMTMERNNGLMKLRLTVLMLLLFQSRVQSRSNRRRNYCHKLVTCLRTQDRHLWRGLSYHQFTGGIDFVQLLDLTRVGPLHQMRFHKPYPAILEFDPRSRRYPPPCHRTGMSLWYSLNGRLIQQDRRRIYRSAGAFVSPFKSGPHGLPEWF